VLSWGSRRSCATRCPAGRCPLSAHDTALLPTDPAPRPRTTRSAANGSKKGKGLEVKPNQAKNFMCLFVNCLVENPAFDSQTKETLTTRVADFGSTASLSDKFIKDVLATGIVDRVLTFARYKATAELQRAGGGKRMARFVGLPKLDDANFAGTAKGANCTLILTEGDSAKSLAIAGLSVVGRDYYGVFPLKGKLLNVREAGHKQIMANAEIQSIVRIMGLQYGEVYTSTKGLRYGACAAAARSRPVSVRAH